MAGHSKFSNIKARKEKNDAARGKVFTRLGKEIVVAVKEGGQDPNNNSKLKQVIAKCKANNMPNDTIERAIKKAAQGNDVALETIIYEGYGPQGVAIIVEALTDNRNRAASNIKFAFTKGGGNVGTPGCVSYMFDTKGQIIVDKNECAKSFDDIMLIALEAGAIDVIESEEIYEILTNESDFSSVCDSLIEKNISYLEATITRIPQTYVSLTNEEDIKNIEKTLDMLDDDDDVQNVYHNWE